MKNLLSYLIKTDEEPTIQKQVENKSSVTTKPSSLEASTSKTNYIPSNGESKKGDYTKILAKAIQESHDGHPSAPDYVEFVKALAKMDGKPLDEETKFTSIFAGFEVQGVTVEKLVSAAEHYKQVVSQEKTQFEAANVDESNNTIGKAKASVAELTAKNSDIDAQMKKLAEQKQANSKQIDALNGSIQSDGNKLECRKNDFESAYTDVITEIDNNIGLIKKHLQKAPIQQ
jgi:uncharacterized protein (DUF885 family)